MSTSPPYGRLGLFDNAVIVRKQVYVTEPFAVNRYLMHERKIVKLPISFLR